MAVYVDPLFRWESKDPQAFRVGERNGHMWCHMFADTDEELHALAARIGMRREWHQPRPPHRLSHYDLTPGRRKRAVALGALEVNAGHKPGDPLPPPANPGLFDSLPAPEEYGW